MAPIIPERRRGRGEERPPPLSPVEATATVRRFYLEGALRVQKNRF